MQNFRNQRRKALALAHAVSPDGLTQKAFNKAMARLEAEWPHKGDEICEANIISKFVDLIHRATSRGEWPV